MINYVLKRIFLGIFTLFIVITITFFLMHLIPGGPFLSEKPTSQAVLDSLNEKFGLDKPLLTQYRVYLQNILKGDLGPSIKQRGLTVNGIISTKFPVSARIGGLSILFALLIGIPLGAFGALFRGKWPDRLINVISTFGISVPSFVLSILLMFIFSVKLKLLPTTGLSSPQHYILPVIALAFYPTAYISRLMRTGMLDVLGQDYMRTARAKGVPSLGLLFKHALKNAILPVVTYLGPLLAYTLSGSFVVEKIFTIPGLGSQFIGSVLNRDYTMIMGTTVFLATLLISLNIIIDILYKVIDPRINFN